MSTATLRHKKLQGLQDTTQTYTFYNFLGRGCLWIFIQYKGKNNLIQTLFLKLEQQIQYSPEGTTVNVSPGQDLATWLVTDEYVDILDNVHLTGILQDKGIWARMRHMQTELKLRL